MAERFEVAMLNLPDDLRAFLEAGRSLVYDESRCIPKGITLLPLGRLTVRSVGAVIPQDHPLAEDDPHASEEGVYRVPIVDLVGECRNYSPRGLLVWLPEPAVLGTYDGDHGVLWAFAGVSWAQLALEPVPFLNAKWNPGPPSKQQLRLWERFPRGPRRTRRGT